MLQEMEQSFAALSSREKMQFLRWAAHTVFSPPAQVPQKESEGFSKTAFEDEADKAVGDLFDAVFNLSPKSEVEIPGFLKRKK